MAITLLLAPPCLGPFNEPTPVEIAE